MNRRNFILGLGTAATLSGAASVTGATLSDTVQPGADFRVVAQENLIVRRNQFLDASTSPDSENYTTVDPANLNFNETAGTGNPNMTVDGQTNDDLDMALATINDASARYNNNATADTSADLPYANSSLTNVPGDGGEAPLEVENPTAEAQEIGVQFNFGDAVGTNSDEVDEQKVLDLFSFFMIEDGGTAASGTSGSGGTFVQVSADDTAENGSMTPGDGAVINSGNTNQVHMVISMSDTIETQIQNAASPSGSGGFGSGATDDVNLLNSVEFGVVES